jgi:uncharacterized membrane protein YraQ (UPF0718 family)
MFDRLIYALNKSGILLLNLIPYILIGIFLAELLKYTPWTRLVKNSISKAPLPSILISSVLGMVSPLCTYGTIPIVIDLYRGGVSLAPLLTFLSASSLMNPQLFFITWGGLGRDISFLRVGGVFLFTILLGSTILICEKKIVSQTESINQKFNRKESTEKKLRDFNFKESISSFFGNLEFVGFYLLLGTVISTLLETFVPLSTVLQRTTGADWLTVIAASVLGIPVYACGGATVPLVYMLLTNGMSIGAALGFLIVGPGTRITPLLALGSFLSKKMLAVYVVSLLTFAIVFGMILNLI